MADWYLENLGIREGKVWKGYLRSLEYEHIKINSRPNIELYEAKENLISGNFGVAKKILDDTKVDLIDFASNYLTFSLRSLIEYGVYRTLGPDDTYRFDEKEYIMRAFYTKNFLDMRKKQLEGRLGEAESIGKGLLNENFPYHFLEKCIHRMKDIKKSSKILNKLMYNKEILEDIWIIPAAFLLIAPYYKTRSIGSHKACPFQRARFYTEFLKDNGYPCQDDNSDIVISENHKKYFLPNMGIDELTPQEMEFYNNEKDDAEKMLGASDKWHKEWIKILK